MIMLTEKEEKELSDILFNLRLAVSRFTYNNEDDYDLYCENFNKLCNFLDIDSNETI